MGWHQEITCNGTMSDQNKICFLIIYNFSDSGLSMCQMHISSIRASLNFILYRLYDAAAYPRTRISRGL